MKPRPRKIKQKQRTPGSRRATAAPALSAGNYEQLVTAISALHEQAVGRAAMAVNQALVLRNWVIGAYLVEYEQGGSDRAQYGERLLERLAQDLSKRGVTSVSGTVLRLSRQFYQTYPQIHRTVSDKLAQGRSRQIHPTLSDEFPKEIFQGIQQTPSGESAVVRHRDEAMAETADGVPAQLSPALLPRFSWSHFVEFIRLEDPWKRTFYENECLRGNWSVRQLQRQIESLLYERTGLSTDKGKVIKRGRQQATEQPLAVADLIRDPYVLEFTGLQARAEFTESDLETALLNHLQNFLLELGTGFCFEARQKRITVGNTHDYVDLVFYHRVLRCHVLLDLKVRAFTHGDAGQMNFYLNYFKSAIAASGDSPPIGILLCSDKDHTKVEFATAGLKNQLFVSRYLVALPKPEQLRKLVERDRERFEAMARQDASEARPTAQRRRNDRG